MVILLVIPAGSFIARTEMDVINGELTAAQARGIHDALLAGYETIEDQCF
ncbi:hypothetical protein ACLB1R_00870 [Escherichia coli]